MQFYEHYKPLRNYIRKFALVPSLHDIWLYSLHITNQNPLPSNYAVLNGFPKRPVPIHPWDLDILTKEIILNADHRGQYDLKQWNNLAKAINYLRDLDQASCTAEDCVPIDILFHLYRVFHRQFPWQNKHGITDFMRAYKVFGESSVEAIVQRELGMSMKQFLLLGTAVAGHFQKCPGMSTDQDYSVLGITRDASQAFLQRVSCDLESLKAELVQLQRYNQDWLYTWNPLEATPLIRFDRAHPDRVICPIPRHLSRRATTGIFYDLIKTAELDNRFGDSFQAYVGEVLNATCKAPRFTIMAETPTQLNKAHRIDGVDWILSDSTAHLFIEAKTKRPTLNAKTHSDSAALDQDLEIMASAIVQHYRNIRHALNGETHWTPNGLPVYPLIVTLEDWYLATPRVHKMLYEHVLAGLNKADLSEDLVRRMTYTVASAHELELICQVIAQIGIERVMSQKVTPEYVQFGLLGYAFTVLPEEMGKVKNRLFVDDFNKLLEGI